MRTTDESTDVLYLGTYASTFLYCPNAESETIACVLLGLPTKGKANTVLMHISVLFDWLDRLTCYYKEHDEDLYFFYRRQLKFFLLEYFVQIIGFSGESILIKECPNGIS